uniref:Uncharacterized protein n=1 Tax=Arundo donax TaxID=35708 RepID=A0A0A9GLW6_ARUDO
MHRGRSRSAATASQWPSFISTPTLPAGMAAPSRSARSRRGRSHGVGVTIVLSSVQQVDPLMEFQIVKNGIDFVPGRTRRPRSRSHYHIRSITNPPREQHQRVSRHDDTFPWGTQIVSKKIYVETDWTRHQLFGGDRLPQIPFDAGGCWCIGIQDFNCCDHRLGAAL